MPKSPSVDYEHSELQVAKLTSKFSNTLTGPKYRFGMNSPGSFRRIQYPSLSLASLKATTGAFIDIVALSMFFAQLLNRHYTYSMLSNARALKLGWVHCNRNYKGIKETTWRSSSSLTLLFWPKLTIPIPKAQYFLKVFHSMNYLKIEPYQSHNYFVYNKFLVCLYSLNFQK